MSFPRVMVDTADLLARVRDLAARGQIKWTHVDPPPEATGSTSWIGSHATAVLTVVRYEQDGQLTSRGSAAGRDGLCVMIYPPLADELAERAEKACPPAV